MDQGTRSSVTAWPTGEPGVDRRMPAAALPTGWSVIGRCRQGTAGPAVRPTRCHVLANPAVGIALLDLAPDTTPNAEARLRRVLDAAGFRTAFPGMLPVWHGRVEPVELRLLPTLLKAAFTALPPLAVQGGASWVAAVRQALDADPAWEAADRPKRAVPPAPVPPPEAFDPPPEPPPAARRAGGAARLLPLGLAFEAVFALGLAVGYGLSGGAGSGGPPPARSAVMPATEEATPATPRAPVAAAPAPGGDMAAVDEDATASPPAPDEPAPAAPEPAIEGIPPSRLAIMDDAPAPPAAGPGSATAEAGAAAPAMAPEAVAGLPRLPPPAATPPMPPRRRAAAPPALAYDRSCGDALFRWQQGGILSRAEMAYVREGCPTRRR